MAGFIPIGGMGMGGGFTLGGPNNLFGATAGDASDIPATVNPAANRAAAVGVRDAYFTANPGNLTQYNNDSSLNIRLFYTTGGDNVIVHQVRQGGAWVDNGSVMAIQGPAGMGTLPAGIEDGRAIVAEGGSPVAGPLRSIGGNWEADQSLSFMGGNIDLTNFNIQSNGPMVTGRDTISDRVFLFGSRQLTTDASADFEIDRPSTRTSGTFQGRNDAPQTTSTELAFNFTNLQTAYIDQYTLASGGSGKFYVIVHRGTSASDPIEYQTHTQAQINAENVFDASNTTITLETNPLFLVQGQAYYFRIIKVGTADLSMGGTVTTQADVDDPNNGFTVVGQSVPQFMTRFWPITQEKVLTETDIPQSEIDKLEDLYGADAVNTTANLVVPSYTIGANLGPGTTIRYTGANNDLLEWLLTTSADDVGKTWRIWNNRSGTYNLRQTAEGARQGNFIASSGLQDARNYIMQPQEIVDVQVESYSATGVSNFTVTPVYRPQVQPDADETDTSSFAFIRNASSINRLPTIPRRSSTTMDAAFLYGRVDFDGSTGDATYTVPTTATTGFADGSTTYVENTSSSNTVTLAAASGVTIDGPTSITAGQLMLLIWEAVSGGNDILHVYHVNAAGGGGGGSAPTVQFERNSATLPGTIADNTIVVVQPTAPDAGTLITVTLPDVGASPAVKRITVANDRPNVNGNVQVNLASGDTISNLFGEIDIMPGDAWQFVSTEENRWIVAARGEIPLFPSFPANPFNGDSTRFQFQRNGDTPTAWTEDRNTSIDLNRASGSIQAYEIANPSTSGITVNDGDGYIFRNVNSVSWQIFPFSSANTMIVDGSTITSGSPLVLQTNTSLVLLYDAGQSRWEGQVFNSLLPQASPGAGGASMANSSSLPDSGKWFARNEDVVDLADAEGVSLIARDGYVAMVKAGQGTDKFLEGFTIGDTPQNDSSQVVYHGPVRTTTIYTGLNLIGDPLSASTSAVPSVLYWDEQLARVRTDDESGAHFKVGEVLSSGWILGTVATPFTSNQTIDTQAEWDAWVGEVQTKDYASAGEVQIPDLAEGSSEVTAVAGTQFILRVPFGQGTMVIRPRGASTIAPKSGSGTTYDNTTPLPMTGGASDEFVIIEVNESANGYYHYPINQDGIVSQFFFDANDYERRVREGQAYDMSVLIQANTTNMSLLRSYTRIPNLVDGIANPAGYTVNNQKNGVTYFTSGGSVDADRVWTINTTASGWTDFQSNRTVEIMFLNEKATTTALIKLSSGNFFGTASDTITIPGGEHRRILVTNTGSATLQGRDVT